MVVYHSNLARQHAATIAFLKLALEHLMAPVRLLCVSIQGVFILGLMVMTSKYS